VTSATSSAASMGFSDYISLLTTQLKYQDPTAPTDNSQMVAQMAQFSQLSGISDLNTTASSIKTQLSSLADLNTSIAGISTKLDSILAAQTAAKTTTTA
jgi:flagellar basal-body rod modification protein FlgD